MRSPAALPKSILVVEIIGMVLLTLAWLAQPVRQPARAVFQPNGGAADDLRGDPADASGRRGVNVASGESDCPAVDANENPTFFIA